VHILEKGFDFHSSLLAQMDAALLNVMKSEWLIAVFKCEDHILHLENKTISNLVAWELARNDTITRHSTTLPILKLKPCSVRSQK